MKANKQLWLFLSVIFLIIVQFAASQLDCVKISYWDRSLVDYLKYPPDVAYKGFSIRFMLTAAAIRIVLWAVPKTGFRIVSTVLSALVIPIAVSGFAEGNLLMDLMGGLVYSIRELTGIGHATVVLSWLIVALQIIALIVEQKARHALSTSADAVETAENE